jgi:predicted nucleotidyltransferase
MKREQAIAELQKACDRISQIEPPLNIAAVYTFGSLPRGVKEVVRDVDLIVIANTTSLREFKSNLIAFLNEPKDSQAPVHRKLRQKYCELSNLAAKVRSSEKTWNWPPLSDFIYEERTRSVLEASGVPPEWLNYFTWSEVFDWRRHGMPNWINLTPERLVRRALFGSRRGFQVHYVVDTLEEALYKLPTRQPVLAWAPDKADVGKNLAAVAKTALVTDDYENMWEQLATVSTKNIILETLCRRFLSKGGTLDLEWTSDQEFIETLACRAGVSDEDMKEFIVSLCLPGSSSIAKLPSMRITAPPRMSSDIDVENVRLKLKSATERFHCLKEIYERLNSLRLDRLPRDLGAYLLECVSMETAPKEVTLSLLDQLGVPPPIGKKWR